MNDLTVQILLTAKDHATKVMKGLGATVKNSANTAERSFRAITRGALRMAQRTGQAFRTMGAGVKRLLTGLPGLIGAALTGVGAMIGGALIRAASDAEEIGSKFDVLFEDVAESANRMADEMALSLGRSKTDFRDYMATVQNVVTPMGLVGEAGRDVSLSVAALAVDLASFNNAADDEALIALRAALVGEAEPLRRFGVMLTQAKVEAEAMSMGFKGVNGELTDQELLLARLSIITRDTQKAQGDAVRTADSYANSLKAMQSQAKDLSVLFGKRLIADIMGVASALGGTEKIGELLQLGFEFIAQAGGGVIRTFGNIAGFALALIDRLGGVEQVTVRMSRGFEFFGNIMRLVWGSLQVIFVAFGNGVRTIAFAVEGLWGILKILTGLLGIGFLEAMRGVLYLVTKLVRGFQILTDTIVDGLVWALNQALDALEGFMRSLSAFFDVVGMDETAGAIVNMADGIQNLRGGLEEKLSSNMLGQLLGDLGAVDLTIKDTQANLVKFVNESWEGLAADAQDWAQDVADTGPVMAQAWETYLSAAKDVWTSGGTVLDMVQEANEAIKALMLEGAATNGQAVGKKTAEEIAAAVEAQKAALSAAVTNAMNGAKASAASASAGGAVDISWMGAVAAGFKGISLQAQATGQTVSTASLALDTFRDLGATFSNSLDGMVDGAVRGTQTMGEAWQRLKLSVFSSIAQMIARMLALKAIGFFFGGGAGAGLPTAGAIPAGSDIAAASPNPSNIFAWGGISSGVVQNVPFQAFAHGGVAKQPTLGMFGENPFYEGEAFIPIPSGGRLPVEGGGGSTYNFNIQANDARGFEDLLLRHGARIVNMMEVATIQQRSYRKAIGSVGRI